mmetsp:Transcript_30905/g.78798  ORF Transcript_30905/g.78798 Transcript_30905/m.78798 type:complete len:104 (-) Transcript_30905:11-322(-)
MVAFLPAMFLLMSTGQITAAPSMKQQQQPMTRSTVMPTASLEVLSSSGRACDAISFVVNVVVVDVVVVDGALGTTLMIGHDSVRLKMVKFLDTFQDVMTLVSI